MTPAPTWYDSKIGSNVRFECKLPENFTRLPQRVTRRTSVLRSPHDGGWAGHRSYG